jgi:hypothetical protein
MDNARRARRGRSFVSVCIISGIRGGELGARSLRRGKIRATEVFKAWGLSKSEGPATRGTSTRDGVCLAVTLWSRFLPFFGIFSREGILELNLKTI